VDFINEQYLHDRTCVVVVVLVLVVLVVVVVVLLIPEKLHRIQKRFFALSPFPQTVMATVRLML
jgi:hypothetical protein